jgi:riboflavin kinase/FMN adenylyltransferase
MISRRILPVAIDDATSLGLLAERECALVVGNFDGVHRGHRAVLHQVVTEARANGLMASVLTFDPHPAAVVGRGAPPVLTTMERRAELMGALGIDRVYVRRFDTVFAAWPAERFVRELVAEGLRARLVVVGENFRFGAKRSGDLALLQTLGAELGFEAQVHPVASDARGPFSSTRAREAIAAGDVEEACRVLGRPHELSGVVVRGDARGRLLGFPTANLDGVAEMLPRDGVYATLVDELDGVRRGRTLGRGVTNIGVRPTVAAAVRTPERGENSDTRAGGAEAKRTIETFVLDFDEDLYGGRLRVHLMARLRDEKKFGSLDALKAQIAGDVADARARLQDRETSTT